MKSINSSGLQRGDDSCKPLSNCIQLLDGCKDTAGRIILSTLKLAEFLSSAFYANCMLKGCAWLLTLTSTGTAKGGNHYE